MVQLREFNIKTRLGVKLAYVAYLELDKGVYHQPVTHNITEIMAVKQGAGAFSVDGERYKVNKNDLLIVNANTLHNEEGISNNFGVYIIGIENYSLQGGDGEKTVPVSVGTDRICYYAEQIVKDYERGARDFYENANMLFSLIINEAVESARKTLKPNVKMGSNELINSVKKYLDGHFLEDVTIKKLAERFYTNKTTLMHGFKRQLGVSIMDYVIKKRLKESENWLKISNMTVAEISDRCSFSNPSYFSRYFKNAYGVTPTEFREMQVKN